MEIRSLKDIEFNTIFHAFELAFSDYEIQFGEAEVYSMLKRRGFNPELSFAAFEKNEIVAFTLNGTGYYHNRFTAYDTGTGTLKKYRRNGIAQDIFRHSIPYLKEAGIEQYLLEVLQSNEKAVSIYRKLGFKITQEFNCIRQKREDVGNTTIIQQNQSIEIAPIEIKDIRQASSLCDFYPSWQNSIDSIERAGSDLIRLGAYISDNLVGYCVFDPQTGDLSQIAVDKKHRRKKIASCLFQKAIEQTTSDTIKVLNISPECHSLPAFLKSWNMETAKKQFEMILPL